MDLRHTHCVPCEGGTAPLTDAEENEYLQAAPGWALAREGAHAIMRDFMFKDFKEALAFVNKVGAIAEAEGHHPDITINYNKVHLALSTHAIQGLSQNDFILAAKAQELSP